ncbi:dienelactone hydrolase family protein [Nocardia sp. 2]|uniref:Dienelactone hydrolase family protein n=1 Tax=Nocardia acididurans TaxID=2802282 RepID=A0ABS1MCC7_9NOCA|nr:dienelactone hydrolase family protein [Nocardia acididurans]MBL1078224.1 dienelactone hydrolase family protein [Nocardia acididurans]
MSTIELTAPDGAIDAFEETPRGDGPWPGVIVLHDITGVGADTRRVARKIADRGYLALAPDLFSRGRVRCVPTVLRDVMANRAGVTTRDIHAAREYLAADERCTGKVAVVGFCLGGGFALLVAPQGFDAAAPFYPSGRGNYEQILRGACPVVASYGALDPINVGRGPKLERVLNGYGIDNDVKVYPGVTHGFANVLPGDSVIKVTGLGYSEDAAQDAWSRIFAFFDRHLR